jgi:hypothetical protein
MNKKLWMSACTALCAALPFALPSPAPAAGPGGVLDAVKDLVRAIDQGDETYLRRAFADATGVDYGFEGESKELRQLEPKGTFTFWDVAAGGGDVAVHEVKDLAGKLAALAGARKSKLVAVRAMCASEQCSWATFELERTWRDGDKETVVPFRGTALLRYSGGDDTPHFKVFHWHVARK